MTEEQIPWRRIIWGEINHADDPDYAEYLYLAVYDGYLRWFDKLFHKLSPRALTGEVEAALYILADELEWSGANVWSKYLRRLEREQTGEMAIDDLMAELMNYHWLRRFLARHVLFFRGGEAMTHLCHISADDPPQVQKTAQWLIKSIRADTAKRLASQTEKWVCHICFLRCTIHHVVRPGPDIAYYGCRACTRSWGLLYVQREVVCCLASDQTPLVQEDEDNLYVNWTRHQALFDFDWVWIKQANDEAVERLAMAMGNDLDAARQSSYSRMRCVIDPGLNLSLNTQRIVESMFGYVEVLT